MNIPAQISVIVPVWNEQGSLDQLIGRIHATLTSHEVTYEIIFIDDHSTDESLNIISRATEAYPIRVFTKLGTRGKAQSIYEGLEYAKYPIVAMIDADLQYPPEALYPMLEMIRTNTVDVVVANRTNQGTSPVRQFVHKACRIGLGKVLHGFDCDIQSGMKVFRQDVAPHVKQPESGWAFDLEFLITARRAGYRIGHYDITFAKRQSDDSKINMIEGAWQIGTSALKLKFDELRHKQNAHA